MTIKIKQPFEEEELIYQSNWKDILFDMWMFQKLLNLDLKGTSYKSRRHYLDKFKMDDKKEFEMVKYFRPDKPHHTTLIIIYPNEDGIDTYRDFKKAVRKIEEDMKTHNELIIEFGWETNNLEDSGTSREIKIIKLVNKITII